MEIPTLQPGCPWYELSTWALPNVKWCEASQCSWITEPANTWSNLAYIAVGLGLLTVGLRRGDRLMRWFGGAELVVGVCSFAYHASYTFVLQILDFAAMYLFCALLLVLNLRRAGVLSPRQMGWVLAGGVLGLTALTPVLARVRFPYQSVVALLVVAVLGTELWVWSRRQAAIRYHDLFAGVVLLGVAATFSALDASRLFCDPEDHVVQGHAIWHMLSALALWAAYRFYAPFGRLLTAQAPAP